MFLCERQKVAFQLADENDRSGAYTASRATRNKAMGGALMIRSVLIPDRGGGKSEWNELDLADMIPRALAVR